MSVIIELTIVMAQSESFVKLGQRKDKFKFSKPKEMRKGQRDHGEEQDKNYNGDNSKNSGNGKPHNGHCNNKLKGRVKCFFCDSPHIVRDCLKKKFMLSTIKGDDEPDKALLKLGSILSSVKAKRVRENEKKPMKCFFVVVCIGCEAVQSNLRYPQSIKKKRSQRVRL